MLFLNGVVILLQMSVLEKIKMLQSVSTRGHVFLRTFFPPADLLIFL